MMERGARGEGQGARALYIKFVIVVSEVPNTTSTHCESAYFPGHEHCHKAERKRNIRKEASLLGCLQHVP